MRFLKNIGVVAVTLVIFVVGGGCIGFGIGYVITGNEFSNPHGGAILVAMLMFGGGLLGLIFGAIVAYRAVRQSP